MFPRVLPVLIGLALVASGLAGCLNRDGDEDASTATGGAGIGAGNSTDVDGARANVTDTGEGLANESLGDMPHLHDYWRDRTRVTLLDTDVEPEQFTTVFMTFYDVFFRQNPSVGGAFLELPDGAIVYEGTGQLEITTTWNDPKVTGLAVRYTSAASGDWSEALPLTKDTPLVIPVTPDMTDMPHMGTSRWRFLFEPPAPGHAIAGPFHVKIDVVKMRDITLFPGHKDHFDGQTEKVLLDKDATAQSSSFATRFTGAMSGQPNQDAGVPPDSVVPMRTAEMQVRVKIKSVQTSAGEANNAYLLFRPADHNGYDAAAPVEGSLESGELLYAIPVDMKMVDSPYASKSQWLFTLFVTTNLAGQEQVFSDCGGCADVQVDYHITVTAFDNRTLTVGMEHGDESPWGGRGGDGDEDDDEGSPAATRVALPTLPRRLA